jgi:hypothetical protein
MEDLTSCVQTHELWQKLRIKNKELVADFFILFSRFEYALKRGLSALGQDGPVA